MGEHRSGNAVVAADVTDGETTRIYVASLLHFVLSGVIVHQ